MDVGPFASKHGPHHVADTECEDDDADDQGVVAVRLAVRSALSEIQVEDAYAARVMAAVYVTVYWAAKSTPRYRQP